MTGKEVSSKDQPMTETSVIYQCTRAFSNKRLKIWNQHFPLLCQQSSSTGDNWKKSTNASASWSNASSIATGSKDTLMNSAGFILPNGMSSLGKETICQILIEHCHLQISHSLACGSQPKKYLSQAISHLYNCLHNDRNTALRKWATLGKFQPSCGV